MTKRIKIIIADDQEFFQEGLALMVRRNQGLRLAGRVSTIESLIQLAFKVKPHILLTETKLHQADITDTLKKLKKKNPLMGIIVLSNNTSDKCIVEMLNAGVTGYLLKKATMEEVSHAIISVNKNQPYYCKEIAADIATMMSQDRFDPDQRNKKIRFTERQIEIIKLVCREFSNKEIGEKLKITHRTVESHRKTILKKIKVKNSIGLAVYATRNKLY